MRTEKGLPQLRSTLSGYQYPLSRIEESAENGESLEVRLPDIMGARIRSGRHIWERFSDFLPFTRLNPACSLGEGSTPLLPAGDTLAEYAGIRNLLLKNETQNPTWSFKDRGSLTTLFMAQEMGERVTATISTGNMGHSVAAYAAKAGIGAIVFVPSFTPAEKLQAMAMHGASVIRVHAPDYSAMKNRVLQLAGKLRLRIVSGNGPVRVEGYKLTAFEMVEQMEGCVPDFIAVPTSACGHIRGLFKGYFELREAGLIGALPRMILVQARNNSPIASAIKQGREHLIPFVNFHTVAEAITSGNPLGGDELIDKAKRFRWLAEDVTEEEILDSQQRLARGGFFVEPAAATSLGAVRSLREQGKIEPDACVVLMLTGSGLKDQEVVRSRRSIVIDSDMKSVEEDVRRVIAELPNAAN
jgi:threonine synthase